MPKDLPGIVGPGHPRHGHKVLPNLAFCVGPPWESQKTPCDSLGSLLAVCWLPPPLAVPDRFPPTPRHLIYIYKLPINRPAAVMLIFIEAACSVPSLHLQTICGYDFRVQCDYLDLSTPRQVEFTARIVAMIFTVNLTC